MKGNERIEGRRSDEEQEKKNIRRRGRTGDDKKPPATQTDLEIRVFLERIFF